MTSLLNVFGKNIALITLMIICVSLLDGFVILAPGFYSGYLVIYVLHKKSGSVSDVSEMSREESPGNWLLLFTIPMGVLTRIFYIVYCPSLYLKSRAIFMARRALFFLIVRKRFPKTMNYRKTKSFW